MDWIKKLLKDKRGQMLSFFVLYLLEYKFISARHKYEYQKTIIGLLIWESFIELNYAYCIFEISDFYIKTII